MGTAKRLMNSQGLLFGKISRFQVLVKYMVCSLLHVKKMAEHILRYNMLYKYVCERKNKLFIMFIYLLICITYVIIWFGYMEKGKEYTTLFKDKNAGYDHR